MFNLFKNKYFIGNNKGFMMVEIMVASSIIVASFLAVIIVAHKSVAVSKQALHTSQASFLLEEGAEAVRIVRDNGWANISSLNLATNYYPTFSGGTWTLSTTLNTVGIFTRKVVISAVNRNAGTGNIDPLGTLDTGTKLVTVTVTWFDSGVQISKTLSFYINDIFS